MERGALFCELYYVHRFINNIAISHITYILVHLPFPCVLVLTFHPHRLSVYIFHVNAHQTEFAEEAAIIIIIIIIFINCNWVVTRWQWLFYM